MTTLTDAHTQWRERPPDERFSDLESLYRYTNDRFRQSRDQGLAIGSMRAVVTPDGGVAMNGEAPPASFSHWAFNQMCTAIGAPARYLRGLPPDVVRDCLNHGLGQSPQNCRVLFRDHADQGEVGPRTDIAALTGPAYGRIWDVDVVDALIAAVAGTGWRVPPAYANYGSDNRGLYASDRDMFAFFVNDEHFVEVGNAKLGKGFFLWNSETGASSFGLTTFLYNYVCGNHIVWGAEEVEELRIIHRLKAPDRFRTQAIPMLNRFAENRALTDAIKSTVGRAMERRIGTSLDEVVSWFVAKPFTKREVVAGFQSGQTEGDDVTTVWGMVQGLTAHARNFKHSDARVDLERRAGALLN